VSIPHLASFQPFSPFATESSATIALISGERELAPVRKTGTRQLSALPKTGKR
jgi:hypothetical protein